MVFCVIIEVSERVLISGEGLRDVGEDGVRWGEVLGGVWEGV